MDAFDADQFDARLTARASRRDASQALRHERTFREYLLGDEAAALLGARNGAVGRECGVSARSFAAEDEILRFDDLLKLKRKREDRGGVEEEASGTSGSGTSARRKFSMRPPAMTRVRRANMESAEGLDVGAEMRRVMRTMIEGGYEAFPPHDLLRSVWKLVPSFAGNEQQDAHEFMRFLLDRVRKELSMGKYAIKMRGMVTPRRKEHSPGDNGIPNPPTRARSARKRSGHITPTLSFLRNDDSEVDGDSSAAQKNDSSDRSSFIGMPSNDDKDVEDADSGKNAGYIIVSRWGAKRHKAGCICRPCKAKRKQDEGEDAPTMKREDQPSTSTAAVHTNLQSPVANSFATPSRLSIGVTASEVRKKLEESMRDDSHENMVRAASPRTPPTCADREDGSDVIMDMFGGMAVTRVTCMKCENFSERREPFMDLSLPIPPVVGKNGSTPATPVSPSEIVEGEGPNGEVTLQQCLAAFVRNETLSGHGRYFCEACGKVQSATKSTRIAKLPPILCLHLKRFMWRGHAVRAKLTNDVDFPLENLDLSPYCESDGDDEKPAKVPASPERLKGRRTPRRSATATPTIAKGDKLYDLVAVVTHHGSSANSGHYTACAREFSTDGRDDGWQHFNDDEVNPLTAEEVRTGQGYIFLYSRKQTN